MLYYIILFFYVLIISGNKIGFGSFCLSKKILKYAIFGTTTDNILKNSNNMLGKSFECYFLQVKLEILQRCTDIST